MKDSTISFPQMQPERALDNTDTPIDIYYGQEIVPGEKELEQVVRWTNSGVETARFYGASTYMFLPDRDEMLDLYFVKGQGVDSDANAVYQSANNFMMIQESSWQQIKVDHVDHLRQILKESDRDEWLKLLDKQDDETLRQFAKFSFQSTVIHEGGHRMHFNLPPQEQMELHNKFIKAAELEPKFNVAANKFAAALYENTSYLESHKYFAGKNSSFIDAYGRTAGMYDSRILIVNINGVRSEVSLGLFITEALAYLSGQTLLKYELNNGIKSAEHIKALVDQAPIDSLPKRTLATRELFLAAENSNYFTPENIGVVFPEEMMAKVLDSIDSHQNVVAYIMSKNR